MANTYINGVSNQASSGSTTFTTKFNNHAGLFQVTFNSGTTGTVSLYGRLSEDHEYFLLTTATGDSLVEVAICPDMKIEWAVLNGTFSATVAENI